MHAPDFFMVGAAKSGTTSLFHYLVQHPSVYIPPFKEPHYFSEFRDKGAPVCNSLEDYLALFSDCPHGAVAGDASTSYLYSRVAASRVHDLNPDARIIVVLRNPVDRAFSFYWHNRRDSVENLSFEDALRAEPRRIEGHEHFRFHYVESGMYSWQVERYFDLFGKDRVRIFLFEDLRDANRVCREIFTLLRVDPEVPIDTKRVHNPSGPSRNALLARLLIRRYPRIRRHFPRTARTLKYHLMRLNVKRRTEMDPATRRMLIRRFTDDILRLQGLLDRDLSDWISPRGA